jgi:predicted PurR-regulated permease PerM
MNMIREPNRLVEISPKTMLMAVGIAGACWLLVQLFPILLICVVSLFLVGTLDPVVDWLERHHVPRSGAIALVFGSLLVATALIGLLTVPSLFAQVRSLIEHAPEIRDRSIELLARSRITAKLADGIHDLRYDMLAKSAASGLLVASERAATLIAYMVSTVFLALYMMVDRDRLRGGLYALVPRAYHIRLSRVSLNLENIVGGYIRGQVLTSVLMAVFTFGLLSVCRVPNPLALAVFAGVMDVLPYIGGMLAIAPSAAAAATLGLTPVIVVVAVMLAYQEFESRVLVPRVYGRTLRLPSSMVLLALLIGGMLLGILGALLALPLAAAIHMLVGELRVALPGEYVDDEAQRASDERGEREYRERADRMPAEQAAAVAVEISEQRRRHGNGDASPPANKHS